MITDEQLSSARQEVARTPLLPLSIVNSQYIRLSDEIDAGRKSHTLEVTTRYGTAALISTRASAVPMLADSIEEYLVRVYPLRIGFDIEIDDIDIVGIESLLAENFINAREALERRLDVIGFAGQEQTTVKGIGSYTGVSSLDFQADGDNGGSPSASWEYKTPEQILRDLQELAFLPATQTANTVFANRLLLPVTKVNMLATTPYNSTGESILSVFLRNQSVLPEQGIRDVVGHPALETLGTGGVGRGIAYNTNSRYNVFHIPKRGDFRDLTPEVDGSTVKFTCQMKTAGMEIMRIKEIGYANIT